MNLFWINKSASKNLKKRTENIYKEALAQHREYDNFDKEEIYDFIRHGLLEIDKLENAANSKKVEIALDKNTAGEIVALWDFSGPGVYFGKEKEDDRYKDIPWAHVMESQRLIHTATLARKISKILNTNGNDKTGFDESPIIVYNGTTNENKRVKSILSENGIVVPPEKMLIIDNENIHNTNDQIKTMVWPEELHQPEKEIGLISHAPHLWRIVHILNKYKTLPEDMKIRLFPVATPKEGKDEYAMMEIRGLLYYSLLAEEKSASTEAYPYIIHGEK